MKKFLAVYLFALFIVPIVNAQTTLEDFEDGGKLTWEAVNGVYNGIIANPDTTGINMSSNVGSYTKSGENAFSLFWSVQDSALDLSENNIFKIQIWSPVMVDFLFKVEGAGEAQEVRKSITQDSAWVEYTLDLRNSAAFTTIDKIILFFDPGNDTSANTYFLDNLSAEPVQEQIVLEDFEDGPRLFWEAGNGTFGGVVENPNDSGLINNSTNVGAYTKSGENGFSLFRALLDQPLDLSIYNKISIQINAPEKTEFIFKLEGTGEALEKRVNIATSNVWREYTMDFSGAADMTTLDDILIFFDPGVVESDDTYLFDNIVLMPADECAGTVAAAGVVDDFECQRNATYDNGWDRITSIENPDVSAGNMSTRVGEYSKPASQAWAALVADYDNPIDLSELNVIKAKIWSPVSGRVLFKLEGGASPAREIFIPIVDSNQWVDYSADFSEFAVDNHTRFALFFEAGTAYENDLIFFVDDIAFTKKEVAGPLEDFEDGGKLTWEPLNNDMAVNGTFNGIIENPDKSGENTTDNVGSYTRGPTGLSTLTTFLTEPIDLSDFTQINMQVWAPEGAQSVAMALGSFTVGLVEKVQDLDTTGVWLTLGFDFADVANVDDFDQINLKFDPGTTEETTWFFDNLQIGETTTDLCEGVEANLKVVDDFECQRRPIFVGEADLEVVLNPDVSNTNNSPMVGKYTEPDGPWSAIGWDFGEAIDLATFNQLNVKIWAPRVVPILYKLEGGTGANFEVFMDISETGKWVDYTIDMSGADGLGHTKLVLFFNAGQDATVGEEFFIDNISWNRAPYDACMATYETDESSILGWTYFANGNYADSSVVAVDNPLKEGINTSDKVLKFVESTDDGSGDVNIFAGMFTFLDNYIVFPDETNKVVRAKILMDHAARVVFKVEGSQNGAASSGDVFSDYTTPNEWQEVTWTYDVADDGRWGTIAVILDFDNIPAETKTYYIDDIVVGATADCQASTSIFNVAAVDDLIIYPNPTTGEITFTNDRNLERFEIYSVLGQKVKSIINQSGNINRLDVSDLYQGTYMIMAFDQKGQIQAKAKFVKI